MRDSIVFYKSFFESISELPEENALNIYNAIFKYAFFDEEPELSGIEKAIFTIIKPQIDANNKRYSNGKKGGRPPKKTKDEENENHRLKGEKTSGFDNRKPNVNVNDNENDNDNVSVKEYSCAEPETDSTPPVIELVLNDKSLYPIIQEDIDKWSELYPSVNVLQQLRAMSGWLDANPTKRKTKQGIRRFINSWLSREQDKKGMSNNGASETGTSGSDYTISYQPWD